MGVVLEGAEAKENNRVLRERERERTILSLFCSQQALFPLAGVTESCSKEVIFLVQMETCSKEIIIFSTNGNL